MIKILVQIKDNCIHFKVRKKLTNEYRNMLNTNIISDNEIIFSDEYILENKKIVSSFLNQICVQNKCNVAYIDVFDIVSIVVEALKGVPAINSLYLNYDIPLNYGQCKVLCTCKYLKYLNCYNLQDYMFDLLTKNQIIVENRSEILFFSNFMEENDLKKLSSIYYKRTIIINPPLSNYDQDDFVTFLTLNNNYLKNIHLTSVQLADIEYIIETLKKYKKRNIKIIIHQDEINSEILDYLKKFKEKQSKRYKIYLKISYSNSYIEKNLLPQTNINMLKLCCLFTILIISMVFGYVFFDNYKIAKEVDGVQANIQDIINNTDTQAIIDELNELNGNTELKVQNRDIASLKPTNKDTVAWIKINNTNIDYAVVQTVDNDYYLRHNFKKQKSDAGWVFMDYRNDPVDLDDNTILYGHNRFSNGTMFGTLGYALKKDWYSKSDNLTITFNTIYENMQWRIFSVYKTPVTVDYLTISFNNDDDRLDFYNMLKKRSISDFKVDLKASDKILTLSTCSTDGGRIVVHAVLIK